MSLQRASHSYQLGANASLRDRVLAWSDQHRHMLANMSPEDVVLSWLEHESRQSPVGPCVEVPAHG